MFCLYNEPTNEQLINNLLQCSLLEKVEQVTSLNYLGVQITSSKDLTTEVRHQVIKASKISGCLNETIWSTD